VHVDEGEIDIRAVQQGEAIAAVIGGGEPERKLRRARGVGEQLHDGMGIVGDKHTDGAWHGGSSWTFREGTPDAIHTTCGSQPSSNHRNPDWFCGFRWHGFLPANDLRRIRNEFFRFLAPHLNTCRVAPISLRPAAAG
jgi:hypothetical protein